MNSDRLIHKSKRVRAEGFRLFAQLVVQTDILQDNLKITQDLLFRMRQNLERKPNHAPKKLK